jgi:hypothetical protein
MLQAAEIFSSDPKGVQNRLLKRAASVVACNALFSICRAHNGNDFAGCPAAFFSFIITARRLTTRISHRRNKRAQITKRSSFTPIAPSGGKAGLHYWPVARSALKIEARNNS